MLTFSQNISRIERITHQVTLDVEAENYQKVREDLDNIHVQTTAAQQQLEKLQWITPRVPGPAGEDSQ